MTENSGNTGSTEGLSEMPPCTTHRVRITNAIGDPRIEEFGTAVARMLHNHLKAGLGSRECDVTYDPRAGELVIQILTRIHIDNTVHNPSIIAGWMYAQFGKAAFIACKYGFLSPAECHTLQLTPEEGESIRMTSLPSMPEAPLRDEVSGPRRALERILPFLPRRHPQNVSRWRAQCVAHFETAIQLMQQEFPRVFQTLCGTISIVGGTQGDARTGIQTVTSRGAEGAQITTSELPQQEWHAKKGADHTVRLNVNGVTATLLIKETDVHIECVVDDVHAMFALPPARRVDMGTLFPTLQGLMIDRTEGTLVRVEGAESMSNE